MPQWGRPSGAPSDRNTRSRDWMQWDAQNRVEELETDDDERYARDRLRFTGYDLGSGGGVGDPRDPRAPRRAPRDMQYEQAPYDDEYDVDEEHDDFEQDGAHWQMAMRQKEEELVDRAMRRINRARLRGESDVSLSREEIDALEKRQLIPQSKAPKTAAQPAPIKAPKPKRRSGGGILGFGGGSQPKQKPSRSARNSPRPSTPEYSPQIPPPPAGYYSQPNSRPTSSPSKPPSRAGLRMAPGPSAWIPEPPAFRPTSSSRGSPTRSLPDDPNWTPRSRSGSAAPLYPAGVDPFTYQVGGAPQYAQGRRNISGPPTVSYSSLRRAPPPAGTVARIPSASGLSQEVVEISSEEEEDDDDEDDIEDDESDEGVTLDLLPESSASGYARGRPAPLPPAGPSRVRRGKR